MSLDITDILARINLKLNNFISQVAYVPLTVPKSHSYKYQQGDSQKLSIPLRNNNIQELIAEENFLTEQSRQRLAQENLLFGHVNQQEHLSVSSNKNYVYEQFQTSKSMQRLAHHQPEHRQQAFLSMKRKNKILEDNVKILQERLKALEENLSQSEQPKQSKKCEPSFNHTFKPRHFPPTPSLVKNEKRLNITTSNQYSSVQNNKTSYQTQQRNSLKFYTPKSAEPKSIKNQHKPPFKVSKNVIDNTFQTKDNIRQHKNLRHVVSEVNHNQNSLKQAAKKQRQPEKKLFKNQSAPGNIKKYQNDCQSNKNSRNIEERDSLRKKQTNRNLCQSIVSSSFSQAYLKQVQYDNPNRLNKQKFVKSKPLDGSKLGKGKKKKFSKHSPY